MGLKPSVEEQEMLAETLRRVESGMSARERWSECGFALAFAVVVAGLWWLRPPHAFSVLPAVLCWLVLVLATRVRFETPLGFTVATQLGFVPLLFVLPVAVVPVASVAALVAAALPEVIRGRTRPGRLPLAIGNSWFAVGPAAVFAIAGTAPRNAGAGLLVGAFGAQFVLDFVISALRFQLDREVTFRAQLQEAWVYAIDAALTVPALAVAEDIHRSVIATLGPLPLLALLAIFAHERRDRIESLLELNAAYHGTALVLGDVISADDGYTGEHCQGVVRLSLRLGTLLGLDAERLRNLEFGALLHDVGKIAIPKAIINKPGPLDPEEWTIVETHTTEGQKMLDRIGGFMRDVGAIVRSHHERWDGSGYPDRLSGEAIPLEARIISCCDAWNAMRTDRPYRRALSHEVAQTELLANAGSQFDPRIVATFLRVMAEEEAELDRDPAGPDQRGRLIGTAAPGGPESTKQP
jgi:putative nucleotidyltransferase with HDIG domain